MNKYAMSIIFGILGAGAPAWGSGNARANQVLEQPPVILEYNLPGPAQVESEPIFAAGLIKTICIAYEFTGQVRLEVSTNGGIDYVKIINGALLVDGFIPGNQLRLRATVSPDSSLKKVIIGYTDSSDVSKMYRNPDLANYRNHREIYIAGGSQEVFNYPLRVDLDSRFRGNDAGRHVDGNDVYFTAADGQTPLYYYVENKTVLSPAAPRNDTPEAIYWIKVPQIPREGTKIYLYYNSEPSPRKIEAVPFFNDGNKVFPFFEDFSGQALNMEKWEVIPGLKKECGIKDGYLQLKDCLMVSRVFKTQNGVLEFKAKAEEGAGIQAVVRTKISSGLPVYEQIVYSSNYPGAEHVIAINNIAKVNINKPIKPLTFYYYKATFDSNGILFERYNVDGREKQAEIKFLDVGNFNEGYLGLKADSALFDTGSVYFDWVRARPYVEVEPVVEVIR